MNATCERCQVEAEAEERRRRDARLEQRRQVRERLSAAIAELTRLEEILLAMLASESNPRRSTP